MLCYQSAVSHFREFQMSEIDFQTYWSAYEFPASSGSFQETLVNFPFAATSLDLITDAIISDLFEACYGLTLGSLGTAIATWRNSLVFHSTLFISSHLASD